ncbi:hypothetical protein MLD38_000940 [Melastoma candidum]|uniref:Uncharacterized protein n=1 Tax=Melastoma candidum TaxID=119954 RepID=A0ACB9SD95_9MYRT|nr:hypothetical protein MLD38_000940 [Melastoma candidum]
MMTMLHTFCHGPIVTLALLLRQFFGRQGNTGISRVDSIQDGIAKLHHASTGTNHRVGLSSRRQLGYSVFCHGDSRRLLFSWTDHPSSMMDTAERSWSRFAFMGYNSFSSSLSSLRGACVNSDPQGKEETKPVIRWEVAQSSADVTQKNRQNPGLKQVNPSSPVAAACVIKTALPLPFPPLGGSSFPQDAYFEITILESRNVCNSKQTDWESPFKYSPANTHRTSNPCFMGTLASSPARGTALLHADGRELFSMGRIDSQWLHRSLNRGGHGCHPNNSRQVNFDQESGADLLEVVLDGGWQEPTAKT